MKVFSLTMVCVIQFNIINIPQTLLNGKFSSFPLYRWIRNRNVSRTCTLCSSVTFAHWKNQCSAERETNTTHAQVAMGFISVFHPFSNCDIMRNLYYLSCRTVIQVHEQQYTNRAISWRTLECTVNNSAVISGWCRLCIIIIHESW